MRGIASQDRSCRYFHTLAAVNRLKQWISNFGSTTCRIRSPLAEYVLILAQPARARATTAVLHFHTCQVSRIFRDYPGIEAIIPDPGLHADFPGIQANLPGTRILRKNTTFHTGMASCARIFCRTALQCSQIRARQRA